MPSPAQALRNLLGEPGLIVAPGCFDALSARLVERAGFGATFMSGFAVAGARSGLPDTGLLSYGEVLDHGRNICDAVSIPVIGDADTGYGNALNVQRTVRGYAAAGFACAMIEDQVAPKQCGHTAGKGTVGRDEAANRIRAAVDARDEGSDILVMARTDARATDDLDEAIARSAMFRELGADITFLEAPLDRTEMRRYCAEVDGPKMVNLVEQGSTPFLSPSELADIGYKIAIQPLTLQLAAVTAMQDALGELRGRWAAEPDGDLPSSPGTRRVSRVLRGRGAVPLTSTAERSERHVIAFLAFTGILLAFGIDSALPAFDELRDAFGLEADSSRITLIVTWYFAGTAVGQLFYGPISDRFGRIPALRLGLAVYSLGAIGSILAPSLGWLFVSRFVWGFGAASPGVIRAAIARDLYEGNQMARVISIYMAFFLIGPVLAPAAGDGILALGSWEWVFGAALILSGALAIWTGIFGETLAEENRRPLDFGATFRGFRHVYTTRATFGYAMGLTFSFGAFIVFLGSAQPIMDVIYDRDDEFAFWFGAAGLFMAMYFFAVNPFINRFGAHRVSIFVASASVALSTVLLVAALAADGVPSFWVWLVLVGMANAFTTLLTPTCYALGLEPMGELAGTASAIMGFTSTLGGSALAAVIDAQIDGTVTPMAVGYVLYGGIALGFLLWAGTAGTPEELRPGRLRPGRLRPGRVRP